jgi:hypothetical protein
MMAIVKKGSRRIVVDDVEYRWRVRQKPPYDTGEHHGLNCSVERVGEKPGAILVVHFPEARLDTWIGSKSSPIVPSHVASAIRGALQAGWQPLQPGTPFNYFVPEPDQADSQNKAQS